MKFKECSLCAAKTGTPKLCSSCLSNRQTIRELEKQIADLKAKKEQPCIKGEPLKSWITWLKLELTPPYSQLVQEKEVKHVLEAFLELCLSIERNMKGGET